ncbi:hypothetical protein [Pseudoxanthomonas winnipegensis]|uniref:Uncharacterized protein n=1 Tax=Pseudoxanthomonas winnipegensis TaxID=2480810 RepID=A0A4Q8LDA7_9GAMM|nr:hypothetical protein [Pseudoxanthomonas winnipegensis]TAA26545.1 hypothetical protein EA660_04750 [Pseudoxanthomonas winnipegensis]
MKTRYFIAPIGSPLHIELDRLSKVRKAAAAKIRAFLKAEGCSQIYGTSPETYLFDFQTMDQVDLVKWAKVEVRRRGFKTIYFRPKRNTPEGKALAARINALPQCPALGSALNVIPGLREGTPMAMDGSHVYFPTLRYYNPKSKLAVVTVPVIEVEAKTLAAYAKQAASKKRHSWNTYMDAALWQPPEWLTEAKEWEVLKAIDEDGDATGVQHG